MSVYYSPSAPGFFAPGQNVPEDAVEITDAQHQELIEGQAQGMVIEFDGKLPVLKKPKVTEDMLCRVCKATASSLLVSTDWAMVPDVADSLANLDDFIAYRAAVRDLRINPVAAPKWPEQPKPIWVKAKKA